MGAVARIAWSVLVEAVRRKELYVVVAASCALIVFTMTIDFFGLSEVSKFHREIALKLMSYATALATIVLAARQLPREFSQRTIYPLLARPIRRSTFVLGKLVGVLLAAAFCFALFMAVHVIGTLYLGHTIPWQLLAQYMALQLMLFLVLAALSFLLSLLVHLDAAITLGVMFFALSATYTNVLTTIYPYTTALGQAALRVLNYAVPQLVLFDLSAKAVHADEWEPLSAGVMLALGAYGMVYVAAFVSLAMLLFRRREL